MSVEATTHKQASEIARTPRPTNKISVVSIQLATDFDRRIALASVRIGVVVIRGVAVWRSRSGKLRAYLPSSRISAGYAEAISLPDDLRTEVEAEVIAAYRSAKAAEKAREKAKADADGH